MLPRDYQTNPAQANPDIQLTGVQYERNPGAVYGEHIRNVNAMCNTSASHTYGNVMSVVEKFLVDSPYGFPKDLFKTVIASTTLSSRQLMHRPNQLHKKELPMMVLSPRIVFGQDEDRFLGHTLINDRYTDTHALWGDGSLLQLAADPRNSLWVHGHYNRAVMYIDIVLSFNTYSEQTNYMSYIHNIIGVGHNKFIRTPLELYIPGDFCELISNIVGIPVHEGDSVYNFLTYMNSVWHHPITYKLKGGSNTDEFFMYYIADIDMVIQDVDKGTGVKDGQIKRSFDVTFTVRCDFNTVGYFMLTNPKLKQQINIPPKDLDKAIVPIFTDVINLDDFKLPIGWKVLSWPIFKLNYGENSISIDNVLNESLRVVIDHHLRVGLPMDKFINIQFRENGSIVNTELYYIDWVHRMLVLTNPNQRKTYRLIITVSVDYVNNLIKELYNLE